MRKIILGAFVTFFVAGSIILPKDVLNTINNQLVTSVSAESEERTEGDYKYVVRDNDTIKITEYIGNDKKVKIKNKIEDKKVTIIGSEAFMESDIKKVTIPDGVIIIGERTFADCKELTSVTFADSVKVINKEAFLGCEGIKSIRLPEKLKKLEKTVFEGCTGLKKVTVPKKVRLQDGSLGYDGDDKIQDFEIKCYEGSYAQDYAEENQLDYTILQTKKTKASPTPDSLKNTPVPSENPEDLNTPKPTSSPDKDAVQHAKGNEKPDAATQKEPNAAAAVVVIIVAIIAIIGCIIVVARRRK